MIKRTPFLLGLLSAVAGIGVLSACVPDLPFSPTATLLPTLENAPSWEESRSSIPPGKRLVMGWDNDTLGLTEIGYQVTPGDTLTGTFHVLSQEREERLLWTMILDGIQVEFTVDGERELLFPTHLGPGEETSFVFETPPLAEGFHNVIFICFLDYDNHSPKADSRRVSMFPSPGPANVWSGDVVPVPTAIPNPSLQWGDSTTSSPGIWLSRNRSDSVHDAMNRLQWTIRYGERLDYFVHIAGSEREAATGVALLAFLDYHQISLQVGDPVGPLVSAIAPGEHGVKACSLIAPQEEGPHELQFARINSVDRPFTFSTATQTDEEGRYRAFSILSSQRVLLEVSPGQ
ncbi:MAG: hypothetical protein DRI37_05470 [Chloroflexi bacterium]|nr:MAG: hypothetical protein DRI37_05470 [Chloroflexota bacterium]